MIGYDQKHNKSGLKMIKTANFKYRIMKETEMISHKPTSIILSVKIRIQHPQSLKTNSNL